VQAGRVPSDFSRDRQQEISTMSLLVHWNWTPARRLVAAWLLMVAAGPAVAAQSTLTLQEAWNQAEQANPALRAAQANLAAAEGQLADSRGLLWNNPQLFGDAARRLIPQPGQPTFRTRDLKVGLGQTFEIAGQQGHRREAAEQEMITLRETIDETRSQLRAVVEQRFARVLSLQLRIAAEDAALKLFEDAAVAVRKQAAAGEVSRLDGNLAQVEAERARNQRAALNEQLTDARAELAALLQLPPQALPEAGGELVPAESFPTLDQLLTSVAGRPLLRSLDSREKAARSRLDLERAAVYPDVTVGLSYGTEGAVDGADKLTTLSVSVPLPFFRRNATAIGRATTELTQSQIDRQAADRDARAQVIALWQKRESVRERVQRLEQAMLVRLDENQQLSEKSRRAGEIGLLQLIVVNRQVLDGRRDLLDARTELRLATIALKAAAGWPLQGDRK
jgi:cobalt-zinc-cadmium efflux system outer membrane protein